MYKPRTIGQFKVMEFLEQNFVTEACVIWPISRNAMALEDRDGERIGFAFDNGLISECELPCPGSPGAVRMFVEGFRLAYPHPEMQTFENLTKQWLKAPTVLTYQQALGLSDELFRHYLTHPMLTDAEVLVLTASGQVSPDDHRSITLWYLDGRFANNCLRVVGVDGEGTRVELSHILRNLRRQFYIVDQST